VQGSWYLAKYLGQPEPARSWLESLRRQQALSGTALWVDSLVAWEEGKYDRAWDLDNLYINDLLANFRPSLEEWVVRHTAIMFENNHHNNGAGRAILQLLYQLEDIAPRRPIWIPIRSVAQYYTCVFNPKE
jgi:hypothetical protein